MDKKQLSDIFNDTIDPNRRVEAEELLSNIHTITGFSPCLLEMIMRNDIDISIRQAGVIYLKNFITSYWHDKQPEEGEPKRFTVYERDRAMIRNMIVDDVIQAPDIIRVQLCICLKTIIKFDFPEFWTQIVDKIYIYLQSSDVNYCMGALLCLYQLIKNYNYIAKKSAPLVEAMNVLLPMMHNIIVNLQTDQSIESTLIQKQILKCFYSLIKYHLPMDLITRENFIKWMEILRLVMKRPVPEHTLQVAVDDRPELPWWKCKKWAAHILYRLFKKYGSPSNNRKEKVEFAEWYLTTFTGGILEVLLEVLNQYRNRVYVSPRVLQRTLNYIDQCVNYAFSWKLLKPNMFAIIQEVLFPLLCYSETDEELWNNDPHEYIRLKFDVLRDLKSPVTSAQMLLISICEKRKGMLERTIHLCVQVLTSQSGEFQPNQREGALHILGTLSTILIKNKCYKDEIDSLLSQLIFPEFQSPFGYMRARACWVLYCFSSIHFKNEQFLFEATQMTVNTLLRDVEMPVRVEAAITLKMILKLQNRAHQFLQPQVIEITTELLKVIRETENDDIAHVLQKLVPIFTEQVIPMAYDIIDHLATTFIKLVIDSNLVTDKKAITATSLLATIETVLIVVEDNPEIMMHVEKPVLNIIGLILHHNITEYYEDAMTLLCNLTINSISQDVWKMFELLYQVFEKNGFDYFMDMTPALFHYVTVDTPGFLSNESHVLAIFNMVKAVLSSDSETESEIYASKLLEVMVLQCSGKIDNCIFSFVELVLNRLTRKDTTSRLRIVLLQVLIAVLYCNPHLLFSTLEKLQESTPNVSLPHFFIKQWMDENQCFVGRHNRKLCILGICKLLEVGPQKMNLEDFMPKLLPSCLMLFKEMKRVSQEDADDETFFAEACKDDFGKNEDVKVLSSDEDDTNNVNDEYLKTLFRIFANTGGPASDEKSANMEVYSDEESEDSEDPDIRCYTTPLEAKISSVDEYIIFKNTLSVLSTTEPVLFNALTNVLTGEQQKQLDEILVIADKHMAQQAAARIEELQ